ncbi:hypothetical protein [Chryseobacterium contaminans]|uniref:hypothetical protein n=1 Tax=Chryseobacterium contaminans TaxID=1423959 RepID=UPI001428BB25|nr:hypothetical protein [Chryseobacterium contaminans]
MKIIGWSESQDLKNDSNIRKEVDAFYEDFKRTLETGSQSKYLAMLKNSIHEEAAYRCKVSGSGLFKTGIIYHGERRSDVNGCHWEN